MKQCGRTRRSSLQCVGEVPPAAMGSSLKQSGRTRRSSLQIGGDPDDASKYGYGDTTATIIFDPPPLARRSSLKQSGGLRRSSIKLGGEVQLAYLPGKTTTSPKTDVYFVFRKDANKNGNFCFGSCGGSRRLVVPSRRLKENEKFGIRSCQKGRTGRDRWKKVLHSRIGRVDVGQIWGTKRKDI
jgi:hypothetical protein